MGQERLLLSTCERSGGNWGKGIFKTNLTNQMYQFSSRDSSNSRLFTLLEW